MGLTKGEGDVAYVWRCFKCGLSVEAETSKQALRMADVHEELVHRLGLYIPEHVEPEPVEPEQQWVADVEGVEVLVRQAADGTVTVATRRQSWHSWSAPVVAEGR